MKRFLIVWNAEHGLDHDVANTIEELSTLIDSHPNVEFRAFDLHNNSNSALNLKYVQTDIVMNWRVISYESDKVVDHN